MASETPLSFEARLEAADAAWLASSSTWNDEYFELFSMPHAKWLGKKVLRRGNHTLTGLWELVNQVTGETHARMVVKQKSLVKPSQELSLESKALKVFRGTSKHVIQLTRERYESQGNGAYNGISGLEDLDPLPEDDEVTVERLYLEYCENGGMQTWMKEEIFGRYSNPSSEPMPEWIFWKVWEALARGICVLTYGVEKLDGGNMLDRPYVHFDIQPKNILVGGFEGDHTKVPVIKIANFGRCQDIEVPQTDRFRKEMQLRGNQSANVIPPEQNLIRDEQFMGSWSNVWQAAKCVSTLFTEGEYYSTRPASYDSTVFESTIQYSHPDINNNEPFETFGPDLKKGLERKYGGKGRIYSENVDKMLYWCLAVDVEIRPGPRILLSEILKILNTMLEPGEGGNDREDDFESSPPPSTKASEGKERREEREERGAIQEQVKRGEKDKEGGEPPPSPPQLPNFSRSRLKKFRKLRAYRIDP
ncbi:hypothetical protein DSL72_000713 [Monilinia vaccinii-corymbosi]|uniref:Protein kinase domain-containing protein n=1 Tax=Monilinia vaccinii-corymbosi TaxID=61207 RepID=A0A8A3P3H0_9HELO|nr:hypothetical protein DSL72_000713 [Monilinia vaccinii-corymbosi]